MPPGNPDRRDAARTTAGRILSLSPAAIEADLLDFITTDGDVLLKARAGSGKTTALVSKVAHMVLDQGIAPDRIMMTCFNNATARSLEKRLSECGVPDGVRVRTFHALGQRIVRAHFGTWRRCVFDARSEDGKAISSMMSESLEEIVNDRFFQYCASRMRTSYRKRQDYVESIGRDALASAANFLRARGYGLQNIWRNAWDTAPIAGNAMKVVLAYEGRLKDAGLLDGPGVLQAASWTLDREMSTFKPKPSDAHDIDHLFIDEYQDISAPYVRLISAIRDINGDIDIQVVGDDWQGINSFAGADLDYFREPGKFLDAPKVLKLLKNRRSGSDIVAWGNAVMADAGDDNDIAVADPVRGAGSVRHHHVSAERDIRFIAQKLADLISPDSPTVALIARRWKVGDHDLGRLTGMVRDIAKNTGSKVTGITAHGAKGLEYSQVLLLDDGSFPINHPSRPILDPLVPDTEFLREEACLKHVAGTRARDSLDIVTMT